MRQSFDPDRLDALSKRLDGESAALEEQYRSLERRIERALEAASGYHEDYVRSAVSQIKEQQRRIRNTTQGLSTELGHKATEARRAASRYRASEAEVLRVIGKNPLNLPDRQRGSAALGAGVQSTLGPQEHRKRLADTLKQWYNTISTSVKAWLKDLGLAQGKSPKPALYTGEINPGTLRLDHSKALAQIKALEDILNALEGKETLSIWELTPAQRDALAQSFPYIITTPGPKTPEELSAQDLRLFEALQTYRIQHSSLQTQRGYDHIDSALIRHLITGQTTAIHQAEQTEALRLAEKARLIESMEKDYAGYLQKGKAGAYYQEYLAQIANPTEASDLLYGKKVIDCYLMDRDGGEDVLFSRYLDNAPQQIKTAEYYQIIALLNQDIKNMSLEEYLNTMGPLWELEARYRTRADDIEDLRTSIMVLSLFSLYGGIQGLGTAAALDAGLDTADAGLAWIGGDKAGAAISALSVLLPELAEYSLRGAKSTQKALSSNLLEGLPPHKQTELISALEAQGLGTTRRIDIQGNTLNLHTSTGIHQLDITNLPGKTIATDVGAVQTVRVGEVVVEGAANAINFKVLKETPADEVNNWWLKVMNYTEPPYKPGTIVKEIELTDKSTFVRVFDGVNSGQTGGWIMKAEDILGLSPKQIQAKFALPHTPTQVTDVVLEAGTKLRTGIVDPLFGQPGGGIQFDLMGQRVGQFINARPLN
jgi:hypothetical protein